jgi:hypothetical protein
MGKQGFLNIYIQKEENKQEKTKGGRSEDAMAENERHLVPGTLHVT